MLLIQWLFCWSLISSTLVALSSSIPLYTWASLEVNTIAFIPIILDPNKPEAIRSAIKYFFIQAYASLIFLIGPLLNSLPEITIFIAIMIKLGISPFHNWYPSVIASINWATALWLSTWQKIAPLWILSENISNFSLLPMLAALNALVGGIGGLIQTEIRPLLAFSSIGHIGWLLFSLAFSNFITFIYYVSYMLHLAVLIAYIHLNNIDTPNDLASSNSITPSTNIILAITLLSLGGLPPLLGFLPNLIVLAAGVAISLPPIVLMLGSYINIYYYISIIWSAFITSPQPMSKSSAPSSLIHSTALITSFLALTLI